MSAACVAHVVALPGGAAQGARVAGSGAQVRSRSLRSGARRGALAKQASSFAEA
jgi:hypothetical protein